MKTINKTIEVFEFDELSPDVQKKVVEDNRDMHVEYESWHDPILEGWQEKLEKLGFNEPKILYSGFWSQGDGACFEAWCDIADYIKLHKLGNKYRKLLNYAYDMGGVINIKQSGHYYHEHSMSVHDSVQLGYSDTPDGIEEQIEELVEHLESNIVDYAKEIYKDLKKYYEELREDEVIIELLRENDYLENGTQYFFSKGDTIV
jgi:hypothetical protein